MNKIFISFSKRNISLEAEQTHTLYFQTFHLPKSTTQHTFSKNQQKTSTIRSITILQRHQQKKVHIQNE
jgi:hypothetical protein